MTKVAAAIAFRNNRVLLTRRAPGQRLAGFWEFPGGKLEENEMPEECITRELLEELGVHSTAGEILTRSSYTYPGGAIELIAVRVDLHSTDLTLSVHDAYEWVLPSRLIEMKLAPADIPIAKELARRYG